MEAFAGFGSASVSWARPFRIAAILLACGAIAPGTASWAQLPPSTFRSGIDLVQVDVSVLDKNRTPVRGLTAADFTVLEDGKPRPIVAFTHVDVPPEPAGRSSSSWITGVAQDVATNATSPAGRLVIIALDWSIRAQDQQMARQIASSAVRSLGPADLGAVVFTNQTANAGTPQDFTSDRGRLLNAINLPFATAMQNAAAGPARDPRNINGVMLEDPEGYESGDCHCRLCVYETLTRVADAVRGVPGRRKTLLFISSYFHGFEAAMPLLQTRGGASPRRGIPLPSGSGSCAHNLRTARERMQRAAGLANLTIHVVDPVGSENTGNSPLGGYQEDVRGNNGIGERQARLPMLAELTGGRAVMNTNAPATSVPDILAETSSYYLVGFTPSGQGRRDQLRRIEVKVSRPGTDVRSRQGYFANETADAARAAADSAPLARAVEAVLPNSDLALSLAALPFASRDAAKPAVALVLRLGATSPQTVPESRGSGTPAQPLKVLVAAFDRRATMVASREQTVIADAAATATGAAYELITSLTLKPGRYQIRAAAETAAGRRGTVYTSVDVPDFDKAPLAMSAVVLQATPRDATTGLGELGAILSSVPTVRRDFRSSEQVTAFVRVYQGTNGPQSANVVTRILDDANRTVFESRESFAAPAFAQTRAADYTVTLPLATLVPGEYVVAIEATAGDRLFRRLVRVRVVP